MFYHKTFDLQSGKLRAVVGASGGAMIIAATTEVLVNYATRGMDPLSSVLAPRSYHQVTKACQSIVCVC